MEFRGIFDCNSNETNKRVRHFQVFGGLWRRETTSRGHLSPCEPLRMDRPDPDRRLFVGSEAGQRANVQTARMQRQLLLDRRRLEEGKSTILEFRFEIVNRRSHVLPWSVSSTLVQSILRTQRPTEP